MANGYMPRSDFAALQWMQFFSGGLSARPDLYHVTPIEAAGVDGAVQRFADAYALAIDPGTRTSVAVAGKDRLRLLAEEACRPFYARIKSDPAIRVEDKINIGVRPDNPHRSRINPPDSAPLLRLAGISFSGHILNYADAAAPSHRRKPAGATQLQLFRRFEDRPAEPMQLIGCFTRSPVRVDYAIADNGRIIVYQARWMTRRGETGPWSNPLHVPVATIAPAAARPMAA